MTGSKRLPSEIHRWRHQGRPRDVCGRLYRWRLPRFPGAGRGWGRGSRRCNGGIRRCVGWRFHSTWNGGLGRLCGFGQVGGDRLSDRTGEGRGFAGQHVPCLGGALLCGLAIQIGLGAGPLLWCCYRLPARLCVADCFGSRNGPVGIGDPLPIDVDGRTLRWGRAFSGRRFGCRSGGAVFSNIGRLASFVFAGPRGRSGQHRRSLHGS